MEWMWVQPMQASRRLGRSDSAADEGVLPTWLVRSGWAVVGLGVLGALGRAGLPS